jgi:hypothetical protein
MIKEKKKEKKKEIKDIIVDKKHSLQELKKQFRRVNLPWADKQNPKGEYEYDLKNENIYKLFKERNNLQKNFDKDTKNIRISIMTQNLHFRPEDNSITNDGVCTGETNFQNIQLRRACEFTQAVAKMGDEQPDIICIQEATSSNANEKLYDGLTKLNYRHVIQKEVADLGRTKTLSRAIAGSLFNPPGLSISYKEGYKLIFKDYLFFANSNWTTYFAKGDEQFAAVAGADYIGYKGAVIALLEVPKEKITDSNDDNDDKHCILIVNAHPSPYVNIDGFVGSYFLKHTEDFTKIYDIHKRQTNMVEQYIDAFCTYLGVIQQKFENSIVEVKTNKNAEWYKWYNHIAWSSGEEPVKSDASASDWNWTTYLKSFASTEEWATFYQNYSDYIGATISQKFHFHKWNYGDIQNTEKIESLDDTMPQKIKLRGIYIMGDMNINKYEGIAGGPLETDIITGSRCCSKEYYMMMQRLKSDQPPIVPDTNEERWVQYDDMKDKDKKIPAGRGGLVTWDGEINAITKDPLWPVSFQWIDYILYYHGFNENNKVFEKDDSIPLYMDNRAIRLTTIKKIPEISKFYTDCVEVRKNLIYDNTRFLPNLRILKENNDNEIKSLIDDHYEITSEPYHAKEMANPMAKKEYEIDKYINMNVGVEENKEANEKFTTLDGYNTVDDEKNFECTFNDNFYKNKYGIKGQLFGEKPGQNSDNPYKMMEDMSDHYGVMAYIILDTESNQKKIVDIKNKITYDYLKKKIDSYKILLQIDILKKRNLIHEEKNAGKITSLSKELEKLISDNEMLELYKKELGNKDMLPFNILSSLRTRRYIDDENPYDLYYYSKVWTKMNMVDEKKINLEHLEHFKDYLKEIKRIGDQVDLTGSTVIIGDENKKEKLYKEIREIIKIDQLTNVQLNVYIRRFAEIDPEFEKNFREGHIMRAQKNINRELKHDKENKLFDKIRKLRKRLIEEHSNIDKWVKTLAQVIHIKIKIGDNHDYFLYHKIEDISTVSNQNVYVDIPLLEGESMGYKIITINNNGEYKNDKLNDYKNEGQIKIEDTTNLKLLIIKIYWKYKKDGKNVGDLFPFPVAEVVFKKS